MLVDPSMTADEITATVRRVIEGGADMAPLAELTTTHGVDTTGTAQDEAMALWAVSILVARLMRKYGLRERNGTCFRLATALIDELREAEHCGMCLGQKTVDTDLCGACAGSGRQPMSMTWRADRTRSRGPDFRDRIQAVYVRMLTDLARLVGI